MYKDFSYLDFLFKSNLILSVPYCFSYFFILYMY